MFVLAHTADVVRGDHPLVIAMLLIALVVQLILLVVVLVVLWQEGKSKRERNRRGDSD